MTRFNLQTIVLTKQKLDLKLLLQQMAGESYPLVEPAGKSIEVLETPDTLIYNGDGDKLARVFNNIIKNAVTYSYENTVIRIAARQEDRIIVEVASHGDPIPKHQQERDIFEKFFRLDYFPVLPDRGRRAWDLPSPRRSWMPTAEIFPCAATRKRPCLQ